MGHVVSQMVNSSTFIEICSIAQAVVYLGKNSAGIEWSVL